MSLRTRLVLTVLGLLVVGLVTALGATWGALQDWKGDQNNDVLTSVGRRFDENINDTAKVWRQLAENDDIPSFFQLRAPDGHPLQTVSYGSVPDLAETWPAEQTQANPDGERFTSQDGWLIRTSRSGDNILVLGVRTNRTEELLSRTRNVVLISGGTALAAVALLSWRAVRRGLRPLDDIADTARKIGSGDLSRRVPDARPGTEIGALSEALNGMLGQLETAFAQRQESQDRLRRFLADASHELRTPIATIQGHAELFRRGAANRPDDLAKVMRRIESEAHRMGLLVDELLLLARLDQGRPLEQAPVDLTSLAADAVADALATAPTRHITLVAPSPVTVTGDAARLRQVLGNLLSNVIQHTPPDATAQVHVHTTGEKAVIEVTDTGPGLTEPDRVFERFYRGSSTSRSNGGAGLGLSIVAAVVSAHGGSVTATSAAGSTFRVELPRSQN